VSGLITCPACGETRGALAFRAINRREGLNAKGDYVRCAGCGTLRLEGAPLEEELSAAYARGEVDPVGEGLPGAVPSTPSSLSPARSIARSVRRTLFGRPHSWPEEEGLGRRLLDFGCLDGGKLVEFYQRGWSVAGVDLNRAGIDRARARIPAGYFHAGPIEELPAGETFDVIRADNVLEHIPSPGPIIALLRSHLREGGRFFAYVPSGEALSISLFGDKSASAWVPYHLSLFSRRGLQTLFANAGFKSVQVTPFTPPDWWSLTARQLVAAPGFMGRPPSTIERAADLAARMLAPSLLAFSTTRLAEEWVVEASG
jgi:SAM-dependent methyltransferase